MFFSLNFPSVNFPRTPKSSAGLARLAVLTALLLPALLAAQSQPQLTLLDPVPALLSGPMVTTNVNLLATKGRAVQGSSADGASEMVLRKALPEGSAMFRAAKRVYYGLMTR